MYGQPSHPSAPSRAPAGAGAPAAAVSSSSSSAGGATPSASWTGIGHGYTTVKEIGQGSYGKAALVQDGSGKLYVMKTIDMSAMDSKQRREAVNEVRLLSWLQHPYIVSYRKSFCENQILAIIMDYAEAGDLYQRIARTRKSHQQFPERQILRWFVQAALALKYMHDKRVLHRDLKSQNLFLTASDRLRVGDFGISKVLESTTAFARTAIGTPYYLSPEICQEKPYSFASDIWALGCVTYEMAALRVPFDAQNLQSLVQKITRGPMPQLPSQYSLELRQLCGDLLHRDQASRPTATDIIRRPYVQEEIRRMLSEEKAKAASSGEGSNFSPAPTPVVPSVVGIGSRRTASKGHPPVDLSSVAGSQASHHHHIQSQVPWQPDGMIQQPWHPSQVPERALPTPGSAVAVRRRA